MFLYFLFLSSVWLAVLPVVMVFFQIIFKDEPAQCNAYFHHIVPNTSYLGYNHLSLDYKYTYILNLSSYGLICLPGT